MCHGPYRRGSWCGIAVCMGIGILMLLFCPLRLLLVAAAITLVVLGLMTMRC